MSKTNETNQKSNQSKPGQKAAKRTHSDVSENSSDELGLIHNHLDQLSDSIKELRGDLKQILKKDEIENLITTTISNIIDKMENRIKKSIEDKLHQKLDSLLEKVNSLEYENKLLKEKLDDTKSNLKEHTSDTTDKLNKCMTLAREANKRANYNEQYSRKNNFKIHDIKESPNETEESLTKQVCDMLLEHQVKVNPDHIVAIHRIPGLKGKPKPVLIKLKNNTVKSTIMKTRKIMREKGHRIVDDVTKLNTGLISRLLLHPDIKSAWFFNGSVFGLTAREERIKFDIYDNIDNTIDEFRSRRV